MKKRYLVLGCILCLALCVQTGCADSNASVMRQMFHQDQWKDIDLSKSKYTMCIAPSFSDDVYDDIIAASKAAGIDDPVLPQDANSIPKGSKYYFSVIDQKIDDTTAYELRFYALADERNPDKVYSIWITAVPLTADGGTTDKEFIFSVNDSPEKIREVMDEYFRDMG